MMLNLVIIIQFSFCNYIYLSEKKLGTIALKESFEVCIVVVR